MAKDDPERARRLAEALRENLRRRKQRDRDRRDAPAPDRPADITSVSDAKDRPGAE